MKKFLIALLCTGSPLLADETGLYQSDEAVLSDLEKMVAHCQTMADGQADEEIFGINIIRVGDTCAIVNGDELDGRVRVFLEEENLDWAGVGLWVTATASSD